MPKSDEASVSPASAGGAEENDSARLQQGGRGEESGIDGASSRRREPAGTANLRTTSSRLGEAMNTKGL